MTEPAERIERALRAVGDPERAEQEKRYLKSRLEHHGVSVPAIRRIARECWREAGSLPRAELLPSWAPSWTGGPSRTTSGCGGRRCSRCCRSSTGTAALA